MIIKPNFLCNPKSIRCLDWLYDIQRDLNVSFCEIKLLLFTEESTQNSEENEETSQDEQQVHEESTQNSEKNEETSQDEQQVHEENTQNYEETSQDEHLMATKPQAHQTHWKKKVRTKFYIKNIDEMLWWNIADFVPFPLVCTVLFSVKLDILNSLNLRCTYR